MARSDQSKRILTKSGDAITVRVLDGIIIDDLVVQGVKAEAYRVITGKDVFPDPGRDIKDYLIKTGRIVD